MGASDDVEDCVGCIKLGLLLAVVVNKRSELVELWGVLVLNFRL